MHDTLLSIDYNRLERTGAIDGAWGDLVMATCEGEAAVEEALSGNAGAGRHAPEAQHVEPPGVFLDSISVAGFRGIGTKSTLELPPGPGLPLVIGRNG